MRGSRKKTGEIKKERPEASRITDAKQPEILYFE